MSCTRWSSKRMFIYRHPVDMRKQINGLAILVSAHLERDPTDQSLYIFTNKARDKVKLLIWPRNGFWLLDGYNLNGMRPHRSLYEIEKRIKHLAPENKLRLRQEQALPLWRSFIDWALQTQMEGVRHAGTTDA